MFNFLIVRVLESNSFTLPNTIIYGDVELRPASVDSDKELSALKESADDHRLQFDKYTYAARICTIVSSETVLEALSIAADRFSTILDLSASKFHISNVDVSEIGFAKNLASGELHPVKRWGFNPSTSFVMSHGNIQRMDDINYILGLDCELSQRYLRALHWARHGRHENNSQLKILFNWFTLEALLKEGESDNISSNICFLMGFPNNKKRLEISEPFLASISDHPRYDFWKKKLIEDVDKIRIFRNNSAHSGFRIVDFSKPVLALYSQIMIYGTSRSLGAVRFALLNNVKTLVEFKENIANIFENTARANDIHGNIIYSLDQVLLNGNDIYL
mgnify:FL=1|jgi:hypothetical protein